MQPLPDSRASDRNATLDVLRGMALFGMILVHFHQFFRETTALDSLPGERLIGWIIWLGVEQKAWATFAFLFGVGFALLLRSAAAKGEPIVPLYLRRMAVLALIGAAIQVFTEFHILVSYALCGVALLFLRNHSSRTLFALAIAVSVLPWLVRLGLGLHELSTLGRAGADAAFQARLDAWRAPEAASYLQLFVQRLQALPAHIAGLRHNGASFTLILLGFLAVRRGVLDHPRQHLPLIRRAMLIGLASWLVYWLLLQRIPSDFPTVWVAVQFRYGLGLISDQWLAFTYVGGIVLLLSWRPRWAVRLSGFRLVGRMALTHYVLQCIAFELMASPFGLNLKLRPYVYAGGAVLMFAAQIVLSRFWLARFRYGPLEWGWRTLTYLRWQPLRHEFGSGRFVPTGEPASAVLRS